MFEFAIAKMLHSFTTNIKNINISPTYKNPNVVKFENNIHWLFSNPFHQTFASLNKLKC